MNADIELAESCKLIPAIQKHVTQQGLTLQEQAEWLENQIRKTLSENRNIYSEEERVGLIAEFSLLSEMYAIFDFEKMIGVRESFQQLFPEHFKRYLSNLESLSLQMFWPGCLECRHFESGCRLEIAPTGTWTRNSRFDRHCKSKEDRLRAA